MMKETAGKKMTQGRKKIEIKKIANTSNRQVTFSKRRSGLFKKASELCILSGAEMAIIVQSTGKRIYLFGHPTPEAIVERFINGGDAWETNPAPATKVQDYNRHYSQVCQELEMEKKWNQATEEAKRAEEYGNGGESFWWNDVVVDELELEELEQYAAAMEELVKSVSLRADDLMLAQSSKSLPPLPLPKFPDFGNFSMDQTAELGWNSFCGSNFASTSGSELFTG